MMLKLFQDDFSGAIEQQGRLADRKFKALGLTLTQGGEPTFVPHDTTRPEWNIAALGEEKLFYARRFARQLRDTLYPGAVILQCFGKQYPNEPLPRWQLGVYKQSKGSPIWKDVQRIRLDQESPKQATSADARGLIRRLAVSLSLTPKEFVHPVYEDFEQWVRSSEDPEMVHCLPRFSYKRKSFKAERLSEAVLEKASQVLEPAGWVLPMTRSDAQWKSQRWEWPRGTEITLIPGDSPVGLRLPLKELPEGSMFSALTVEAKDGELIVFVPPLPDLEAFILLMRAIERVATRLDLPPLRLEGYPPPRDSSLESISLMSDPGVIEVNLPPADNWGDFARVVQGMFDAAEQCGLRGYKFQQSGRLVSTGGGAHIILGGPDLDCNPFLHQPALIGSFLRFFQNHPALSYAFTGLFIGPSSQAPRIDESIYEAPYELEIALRSLDEMETPGPAWLMDAILRNLLLDWNGNTHRAEISVDKFYNQESPNGRLGLVEFRAFEMTPTASMHLAVNALLRSLCAAFAKTPYREPLVDWKETLHDRFALPYFLRKDLHQVLSYLGDHGFSFDTNWFEPHFLFRFPVITRWNTDGSEWVLRQALEPWPVMGDHAGTGRTVDSTTDRLEVLVSRNAESNGRIFVVNGVRMPLVHESSGESVGGIRYRLFDNSWGLQPQVGTHSPMRFRIVDQATRRIVHAFDYLNWKRDGESYDGLPHTEEEANRRVWQRVVSREDLVGTTMDWKDVPSDPETPYTLDLRRWNAMLDREPA